MTTIIGIDNNVFFFFDNNVVSLLFKSKFEMYWIFEVTHNLKLCENICLKELGPLHMFSNIIRF